MSELVIKCQHCGETAAVVGVLSQPKAASADSTLVRRWVDAEGPWPEGMSWEPGFLHRAYSRWAEVNGQPALSQRRVSQALLATGWTHHRQNHGRVYRPGPGVQLRPRD